MDLQDVSGRPPESGTRGHDSDRLAEAEGLVRRTRQRLEELADRLAELRRGPGQPPSRDGDEVEHVPAARAGSPGGEGPSS